MFRAAKWEILCPPNLELMLDPNGDEIKVTWHKGSGPFSKPLKLSSPLLARRSHSVRVALSELNAYVRTNQDLEEKKDPGWKRYASVLRELQQQGAALYNAFFDGSDLRAQALLQALQSLEAGAELRIHCSDEAVSLPLGFVFDSEIQPLGERSSRADFSGFWLDRFSITMLVAGGASNRVRSMSIPSRSGHFTHYTAPKWKMRCRISAAIPAG
jgi:hypothetical protein